jgi:hypothetical protein
MNTPLLSIEALLVLDAIETRGSYAAAAEQLNKVPSALSYIVQKNGRTIRRYYIYKARQACSAYSCGEAFNG